MHTILLKSQNLKFLCKNNGKNIRKQNKNMNPSYPHEQTHKENDERPPENLVSIIDNDFILNFINEHDNNKKYIYGFFLYFTFSFSFFFSKAHKPTAIISAIFIVIWDFII